MPYRIFLVEDHPVMQRAYAQMLARESDLALCGNAEDAEQALDVLATLPCDLVLTDLVLPGMDGIELIERLREVHPLLPVLVLSAHEEEAFVRRARAAGAKGYIRKRDLTTELLPTIRRVLRDEAGREAGREAGPASLPTTPSE